MIVRRKRVSDLKYNEMLAYSHVAIVFRSFESAVLTFETAGNAGHGRYATGLNRRPWHSDGGLGPMAWVATPPPSSLPAGAVRREFYDFPFVPREEELLDQEQSSGMLFPGVYDDD